jgi:hypothetical protein
MRYDFMKNIKFLVLFSLIISSFSSYSEKKINDHKMSWTGNVFRAGLGSTLSFEIDIANPALYKGDGYPANAMFIYGYEYGYHFGSGLHLAAGLDWTIMYPRNFQAKNNETKVLGIPYALWWVPITNLQVSFANEDWLAGLGMIYAWGLSSNVRYRVSEHFFVEANSIVWLDRIFKGKGAFGEGFDNLFLNAGLGFLL